MCWLEESPGTVLKMTKRRGAVWEITAYHSPVVGFHVTLTFSAKSQMKSRRWGRCCLVATHWGIFTFGKVIHGQTKPSSDQQSLPDEAGSEMQNKNGDSRRCSRLCLVCEVETGEICSAFPPHRRLTCYV